MPRVIALQRLDAREHPVARLEREQPCPRRQESAEASFLCDDRPARGQVAYAAVAEPTAACGSVAALRDAELGLGTLDKSLVVGRRTRNSRRFQEMPAVARQSCQVPRFIRMDSERQHELLLGQHRQIDELAQSMRLLAIEHASMLDR